MTSLIHPTAIIEDGAVLGQNVRIGAYCWIGSGVSLGDNCVLHSHVVLDGKTSLGSDNELFPFAVLGKRPQDLKYKGEATTIVIGNRNVFREHTTVHPGTKSDKATTTIGDDNKFFIGVHIAHDCVIGDSVIMANDTVLAGHVSVEDFVYIGGNTSIRQFTRIGAHSMVGGASAIFHDVIPYGNVFGVNSELVGLNLVGMKRRGIPRDDIASLQRAYRSLFASQGTFSERLKEVEASYADSPMVAEVVDFIKRANGRSICQPPKK